jgi:hypothetical protein
MNDNKIDGCTLSVTRYDVQKKKNSGKLRGFTNLYVKNFPSESFDNNDLIV